MAVIDEIKKGLQKDKKDPSRSCYGVDATVVAITPYARSDFYSPTPVVLLPSDKTEKGKDLAIWIQITLDAWKTHPLGEKVHSPIWAYASDGDACFRVARYLLCMKVEINPESLLSALLSPLVVLKHIMKRFATLMRNPQGIMIFDDNLLPINIVTHLSNFGGMSRAKAHQLLDPSDKHNVPKAVSLVQTLEQLSH